MNRAVLAGFSSALIAAACGGSDSNQDLFNKEPVAQGGNAASGAGGSAADQGGSLAATGGRTPAAGGSTNPGAGGARTSGGASAGGSIANGGAPASGGRTTGGTSAKGGAISAGGNPEGGFAEAGESGAGSPSSGGAGSGGAGSGGAPPASGGTAPGGTNAGGSGGVSCPTLQTELTKALDTAQECDRTDQAACSGFVAGECCSVPVNNPESKATKAYLELLDKYKAQCPSVCPDVLCSATNDAVCRSLPAGTGNAGRCTARPGTTNGGQ